MALRAIATWALRGIDSLLGPVPGRVGAHEELEGFGLDIHGKLIRLQGFVPINTITLAGVDTERYLTEADCDAVGGVWIPPTILPPLGGCAMGIRGITDWRGEYGVDHMAVNSEPGDPIDPDTGCCVHPGGECTGNLTLEECLASPQGAVDYLLGYSCREDGCSSYSTTSSTSTTTVSTSTTTPTTSTTTSSSSTTTTSESSSSTTSTTSTTTTNYCCEGTYTTLVFSIDYYCTQAGYDASCSGHDLLQDGGDPCLFEGGCPADGFGTYANWSLSITVNPTTGAATYLLTLGGSSCPLGPCYDSCSGSFSFDCHTGGNFECEIGGNTAIVTIELP